MIEFDEHIPQRESLDLTPMIDIVFNLLIFFLLTLSFTQASLPLNLPEAETAVPREVKTIRVEVKNRDEIMLDGRRIALPGLYPAFQSAVQADPNKELELFSDKAISFGVVVEVLDLAKKAGIKNISVATSAKSTTEQ